VVTIAWARGSERIIPQLSFFFSNLGRLVGEALAFGFSISLFYVTYRYASVRRLPWRTALLASTFTGIALRGRQAAVRLYLTHFAEVGSAAGDANIGAAVLFVLWVYYTAIVFLLGGVVAETWELRRMQQRQRAILADPSGRAAGAPTSEVPCHAPARGRRGGDRRLPPVVGHEPPGRGRPGRSARGRDLAAIRATDSAFATTAAAGDAAGVAAIYLPDARVLPPNAPAVQGRDAIQKLWGGLLDAYQVKFDVSADEVEGRGDLAYARGHYTLDGTPKAKGVPPLHDQGKFLEILRRQADGTWRYAVDMYSSDLPVPAAK